MSKRNLLEKQDSNLSKGSLARQNTNRNLAGQKSFFSKFSNTISKPQDEEIQFLGKGQDSCIRVLFYLLLNYDGMEQYLKKQSVLTPLNSYTPVMKNCQDLSPIRTELIYYFQIISVRDFHDFYVDFYATFDKNKNFSLEPPEFKQLLEVAIDKCVGPKKFKVVTDIFLSEPSSYENQLNPKILGEMIENFRDLDKESKIDYLLLFPYILSFFMEYTYSEIKYRQGRLDLMRGTEIIKGKEVEIKNITSLVTILREMGIDYLRDKRTNCLTYRDVENVLIKLKNIQKWITFDIIKQIINQLAKLMQVDPKTQNEGKPLKLHKIVNFLALKLCIHQNCLHVSKQDKDKQKPPSAYLEVLVLWNTAMYGQIMKQSNFDLQLKQFLEKHYQNVESFNRIEALKVLEAFFKKKFQLIPKDLIKIILEQHSSFQNKRVIIQSPITKESLQNELYQMMCKDGYRKLQEYIRISYEGVNKSTNSDKINQYKGQGKDFNDDPQINSPISSERQLKTKQVADPKKQQQSQNNKNNESNSDSEGEQEVKPKQKLKRAVKVISSEQAFAQKFDQQKDVLKACLIMDSFLKRQNQMHQKNLQSKVSNQDCETPYRQENLTEIKLSQKDIQEFQGAPSEQNNTKGNTKVKESKQQKEQYVNNKEDQKESSNMEERHKLQPFLLVRPKIILKDIKRQSQSQSGDIFSVAGKNDKNVGPSNFKNAYYGNLNTQQDASKIMNWSTSTKSQVFQLTDEDFKDDEGKFQVVIDDVQLQTQIQIQQTQGKNKRPKDRSTCYYCSIY
ncbi:unnamed protein product (macronuclear) [Paramecium tetraurelia]|uniref:EF-hand domain-containing protein n=1 Tax=Paramecium tetraurelia TaxID=5888 RepID=A0DW60_PARTE|nr:uncharacterized protein GSPATT00020930001 [Paramecium tetraurelia]CAK87277.1 unnamed protein product [Paramecium tetraurelia]|eukprot:XP_001454674.1 hypothetical protein (macronuclear) [Paramecium tetraurelia strain d4-2]